MGKTKIQWVSGADGSQGETWNPVRGCVKISPGCRNCYAETFAERFRGVAGHPYAEGFTPRMVPAALNDPIGWQRPREVFVNSMSDLYLDQFPLGYIAATIGVMANIGRSTSSGTRFSLAMSLMKSARGWNHGGPILFWKRA